jgi:hypothetical protein
MARNTKQGKKQSSKLKQHMLMGICRKQASDLCRLLQEVELLLKYEEDIGWPNCKGLRREYENFKEKYG